ncbi:Ig-like domain-containing protein, partial [Balneolaceae bacterium ANBcel3]|nr:Ig-like domain-containing protein [Balneolaceae bacterium ANBcel3]
PMVVSIQRAAGVNNPTNRRPFDIVITFNEEIADFDGSELNVTNGAVTGFTSNNNTSFQVSIEANSVTTSPLVLGVGVPAGVFTDLAGNANEADTENFTIEFGDTRPTAVLSSNVANPTNDSSFEVILQVTEIFGQPVSNISASNFAVSNAAIVHIDGSANPEFVLTVEPENVGLISIRLNQNVLTDVAGNLNMPSNEISTMFDASSPTVTISSSVSSPTNANEFEVTIAFDKPVFGFDIGDVVLENASASGFSGNNGESDYTLTVQPDSDGVVSIMVPQGVAQDEIGNENESSDTFVMVSDRTRPSVVSILDTFGLNDPTNESAFDIVITFSEALGDYDESVLSITNANLNQLSTTDNTVFIATLAPLNNGAVRLSVPAGFGRDEAGNTSRASTDEFEIEYNGTPPGVLLSSDVSNPTNAHEFELIITFDEPVSSFDVSRMEVDNAQLSGFAGNDGDSEYTVQVIPREDGPVTLRVPEGVAFDLAGNANVASNVFEVSSDRTPPHVSFNADAEGPVFRPVFILEILFSEEVIGFEATDILADNAEIFNVTSDNASTFVMEVHPLQDGLVTITVPEGVAFDEAGNPNEEGVFTITYDTSPTKVS